MEYLLRVIIFIVKIIDYLVEPIFRFLERNPPKRIPANDEPLLKLSAKKLAKKIRQGELKSEDVVKAYIQRIKEVNPVLNAVVEERFEAALNEAKEVDKTIASRSRSPEQIEKETPLYGVPITVKESCCVKGMSLCGGNVERKGIKASEDGEAYSHLKRAGAICLAVTNTPEYCVSWDSSNLVTGRTRNPYNTYKTAGGSSGGEGALISAAASIGGIGSDLAGSIRLPAFFNGIYGHKPSGRIVSIKGHFPMMSDEIFKEYLVLGPLTRYAEDLPLFMKVIAGENAPKLKLDEKVDVSKLNIFYMEDEGFSLSLPSVDNEIKEAIRKAVKHLKENTKANISNVKFEEFSQSIEISTPVFISDLKDKPNLLKDPKNPKENRNIFLEVLKSLIGQPTVSFNGLLFHGLMMTNFFVPESKTEFYRKKLKALWKKFSETLGDNGVFIYPIWHSPAFTPSRLIMNLTGVMYAVMFNLMGLPATQVPLGLNKEGLPIGFQVIAGRNQDRLCLAVAQELENAFGGWVPPPMTRT